MPRVSIITPTFNCARFLDRAIRSVFAQTYADYELIVVDDGSTDDTREVIASWSGKLHYFYQANRGLPAARNLGVSKSSGEFIAYLDADDMWYPHKLERQVEYLDSHRECGVVHSDLTLVDERDVAISPDWYLERRYSDAQGACMTELLRNCLIQVPTVMERRTCYDLAGGFDERFRRVEDYLHWIRVVLEGHTVGYIDEPLAMYRWRTGSLSKNQAAMAEATIEMFRVLVEEDALLERVGPADREIVRCRVAALQRSLPYHYRQQGRNDLARHLAAASILKSPGHAAAYIELMKSCVPISMARTLLRLRDMFT